MQAKKIRYAKINKKSALASVEENFFFLLGLKNHIKTKKSTTKATQKLGSNVSHIIICCISEYFLGNKIKIRPNKNFTKMVNNINIIYKLLKV